MNYTCSNCVFQSRQFAQCAHTRAYLSNCLLYSTSLEEAHSKLHGRKFVFSVMAPPLLVSQIRANGLDSFVRTSIDRTLFCRVPVAVKTLAELDQFFLDNPPWQWLASIKFVIKPGCLNRREWDGLGSFHDKPRRRGTQVTPEPVRPTPIPTPARPVQRRTPVCTVSVETKYSERVTIVERQHYRGTEEVALYQEDIDDMVGRDLLDEDSIEEYLRDRCRETLDQDGLSGDHHDSEYLETLESETDYESVELEVDSGGISAVYDLIN